MAALTFQTVMRARQVKIRLAIVVKQPKLPAIGVMAGFTLRPEAAKMRVVCLMAGNTFHLDFRKISADMAAFAAHQKVQPYKRKLR